jgi:CheY-like chemotaxis protein
LIIDDDPDITLTFKEGIENSNGNEDINKRIGVYTYNNPLIVLSEFKLNFYDLLLTDINLPNMNGFQLCEKILLIDINVRICFMSSGEINLEALREIYPT